MVKAVVVGATGGIGRTLVHWLARDPRIDSVTALTRSDRPITSPFFELSGPAWAKVHTVTIDYEVLAGDASPEKTAMEAKLHGHDIGFSGLGLYTRDAKNEDHFRHVEITLNTAAVRAFVAGGGTRFAYLSGQGAKEGGMLMFARVKAGAERAIRETHGLVTWAAARPAGIAHRPGGNGVLDKLVNIAACVPGLRNGTIESEEIAKGMIHSAMTDPATVPDVYENAALKQAARDYESSVDSLPL